MEKRDGWWNEFFNSQLANKIKESYLPTKGADLVIANNVLAHVPEINDFLKGVFILLNKVINKWTKNMIIYPQLKSTESTKYFGKIESTLL